MQRSILAPIQPLGGPTDTVPTETSSNDSRRPTSNSLIVPGTTMAVVPTAQSTSTSRPRNARRVYTNTPPNRGNSASSRNLSGTNLRPELQQMMDAMAESNRALFCRSLREILQDHDEVMERLHHARVNNDSISESFYNNLRKKLEAELDALA